MQIPVCLQAHSDHACGLAHTWESHPGFHTPGFQLHSDATPSAAAHPLGLTRSHPRIDLATTGYHVPSHLHIPVSHLLTPTASYFSHAHWSITYTPLQDSHLLRYHRHLSHTTLSGPLLFMQMVPLLISRAHEATITSSVSPILLS